MIHEQCKNCLYCAWVEKIKEKWTCECFRPKYWGVIEEDGQECENFKFCSYPIDLVHKE